MSNKTYLVKLTPGSFFFFGGENTLGAGEARNYLVNSRYFPQQTGILGLLRYCLLQHAGLLAGPDDKAGLSDEAISLIGESSFNPKTVGNYGAIKQLSPVFLLDAEGRKVLPAALNWGMKLEETPGSRSSVGPTNGKAHRLMVATGKAFDPKNELLEPLTNENGELSFQNKDDHEAWEERKKKQEEVRRPWKEDFVFRKHDQIGIQKDLKGTEEDAFYKQTSWYLPEGWCFACYVDLEQSDDKPLFPPNELVTTGGERSLFRFESTILEGSFEANVQFSLPANALPSDDLEKLVLVSDAYLPEGIYADCAFAITQSTPFRYHRSDAKQTYRYFDLERDATAEKLHRPARSQRFTLLKKGSVLYAKPGQRHLLVKKLKDQTAFRNIGYNYFVEAPATNNPISQ